MTIARTISSRISRALEFYNSTSIYFGIGKSSAWVASDYADPASVPADPESSPPVPDITSVDVLEPIGYKQVTTKYLVIPYLGGTTQPTDIIIDYGDTKWIVVDSADALTKQAFYAYVECDIAPADFALGPYRQVGVFNSFTPTTPGEVIVPVTDVSSVGTLEILDNRVSTTRQTGVTEKLSYVLKF